MSASTGIGGLIVGMAMLAVFVMFVGTLDARLSTHLSVTEQNDPPPDVAFVDANMDLNGLVEISITTNGSGYSVGDDVLDGTNVVGTVTEVHTGLFQSTRSPAHQVADCFQIVQMLFQIGATTVNSAAQ